MNFIKKKKKQFKNLARAINLSAKNKISRKELTVKSTAENLAVIRDFVKSAAEDRGFSQTAIDKIILAVDEACSNIIRHAYKNSPDGDIIVKVKSSDEKLTVEITDYGVDFDSTQIPEPDIKKYYRQHKVGGLGIYLMRKLMDEVKYNSVAGKKNQVVLVKYLA